MTEPALEAFGHTDIGRRRKTNQDSYLCLPLAASGSHGWLLAVADGMGGHAGGDVASHVAIEALRTHVTRVPKPDEPVPAGLADLLAQAIRSANTSIRERAAEQPELHGMGTTLVVTLVVDQRVVLANVGDSRAYAIGAKGIRQLTEDHSWEAQELARGKLSPEDIANSPFRNMVTRSLGSDEDVNVDVFEPELAADEYLVLCSDGIYRELDESQVAATVQTGAAPEAVCRRLVDLANAAGGRDNITCVVAAPRDSLSGPRESKWETQPLRTWSDDG